MPSSASVECKQTRTRSSSKESPKVTASDSPVESDTRMASSNPEEKSATGSKRSSCADVTSAPKAKKSKAVPTTRSRRLAAAVSKSLVVTEKALRSRKKSREPEEESSESPEPEEEKQEEPASASGEATSMKDEQEKRGKEEQSHTESEPEERERAGQTSSSSEQLELDAQQKKPDEDENKEKKEEEEKQEDEEQKRILCALRSLSNDLICSEQEPPVPEEPLFENLFEPGKDCKDGVRSEFWKNVVTLTSPSRSPSADEANPPPLPPPPPPQASTENLPLQQEQQQQQQQQEQQLELELEHQHHQLEEQDSTKSTPHSHRTVETSSCEPASNDVLNDVHVNACVKLEPSNQEATHMHSLGNDDSLSSHSMSYPESPSGCGPGGYRVIR